MTTAKPGDLPLRRGVVGRLASKNSTFPVSGGPRFRRHNMYPNGRFWYNYIIQPWAGEGGGRGRFRGRGALTLQEKKELLLSHARAPAQERLEDSLTLYML